MAERKPFEGNESLASTKWGIGENADGTIESFPLSELNARTKARDEQEAIETRALEMLDEDEAKASHEQVDYGSGHLDADHCAVCQYYIFDGPHCALVQDPIRPQDWCELFEKR